MEPPIYRRLSHLRMRTACYVAVVTLNYPPFLRFRLARELHVCRAVAVEGYPGLTCQT
jgi:hypothetical protein